MTYAHMYTLILHVIENRYIMSTVDVQVQVHQVNEYLLLLSYFHFLLLHIIIITIYNHTYITYITYIQ
jgi:hypothetical protein